MSKRFTESSGESPGLQSGEEVNSWQSINRLRRGALTMDVMKLIDRNLSYSEREVIAALAKLYPNGGPVVLSNIADRVGYSRSTATIALRKLAMIGVVETRNMGMKGTYLKVLQPKVWLALARRTE